MRRVQGHEIGKGRKEGGRREEGGGRGEGGRGKGKGRRRECIMPFSILG